MKTRAASIFKQCSFGKILERPQPPAPLSPSLSPSGAGGAGQPFCSDCRCKETAATPAALQDTHGHLWQCTELGAWLCAQHERARRRRRAAGRVRGTLAQPLNTKGMSRRSRTACAGSSVPDRATPQLRALQSSCKVFTQVESHGTRRGLPGGEHGVKEMGTNSSPHRTRDGRNGSSPGQLQG